MPIPLLHAQEHSDNHLLNASKQSESQNTKQQVSTMAMARMLRKKRSQKYMDVLSKLDAGTHTQNQDQVVEIIDTIRQEFPEIELSGIFLGIVSKCYLGGNYEVHAVDLTGDILEHYTTGQKMRGDLESARTLVLNGNYELVEVYVECFRVISSNGDVSVVQR